MTTTHPRESLYCIEDTLQQIQESRAAAEAEGDSEALKVIDQIEREYLTKEAAKVDSYAGLIHRLEDECEACEREMTRLATRTDAHRRDIARLKAHALTVMQQFGVKELKTPTNTLRRQGNGGLQALEIGVDSTPPKQYRTATVTMSLELWCLLVDVHEHDKLRAQVWNLNPRFGVDTDAIREALKQCIPCCTDPRCVACGGVGSRLVEIPGVKLLPRAEHVRVI